MDKGHARTKAPAFASRMRIISTPKGSTLESKETQAREQKAQAPMERHIVGAPLSNHFTSRARSSSYRIATHARCHLIPPRIPFFFL